MNHDKKIIRYIRVDKMLMITCISKHNLKDRIQNEDIKMNWELQMLRKRWKKLFLIVSIRAKSQSQSEKCYKKLDLQIEKLENQDE